MVMHGVSLPPPLLTPIFDRSQGLEPPRGGAALAAPAGLQRSGLTSGKLRANQDTELDRGLASTTCAATARHTDIPVHQEARRSSGVRRIHAELDGRFRTGSVLGQRYRVDGSLGRGGMGVVLAAWDLARQRPVALKLLLPCYLEDDELRERFLREAEATQRVGGNHVPQVYGLEVLEGVGPCFSMERLRGSDLAHVLDTVGSMSVEQAVPLALEACEALAAAHSVGIVHRDIKPANLFVQRSPDGRLHCKLLDFGIAKLTAEADRTRLSALTSAVASVGSPLYMSPEQMRDASRVDHRTDIWSLGAVLYEALTGRAPFDGMGAAQASIKVVLEPPPRPSTLCPGLPRGLEKVILKALSKKPKRRYRDAASFARALRRFAPQEQRQGGRWRWPLDLGRRLGFA